MTEYEAEDRIYKLTAERDKLQKQNYLMRTAIEFYAKNNGLRINFKSNAFESQDGDGSDFHGATAREALRATNGTK